MSKPYFIGITGGSGSGKTLFLKKIIESLGTQDVCIVSQDDYYKDRSEQPKDDKGVENFDTPNSINKKKFAKDLKKLQNGKTVKIMEYTFNNKDQVPKEIIFKPSPIILVEGLYVMHYKKIAAMMDLKLFIEAKDYIKVKRRILRDQKERGYPLEDVLYRYEKHVMPSYEKYIASHKNQADFVINNNFSFLKAMDVFIGFLKSKIIEYNHYKNIK